ncbi:hypothetical protein Leryth_003167 [Lithospermum erythrorhizon]|nr:hypothetical protein Leryth_003167 [Lithospermum erythrorhizon]
MYAGKQVHPFFMSRKVDKRNQDMVDETDQPFIEKEGKEINIYPIHVYEKLEDIAATVDWKQWTFSDTTLANSSCTPDIDQSPIFRGSAKPLQFDNYLGVSQSNSKLSCQNQIDQDQSVSLDQEARGTDAFDLYLDNSSSMICDAEQQSISSQGSCLHHPENCLWTDKYVPEKALQVCGNGEAVKRLSEWLHLWHSSCSQASKIEEQNNNCMSYQSYCDSEDLDEEPSLENVLLITGPVGSGKSATIYACAKEQGFQVIEVNTSDWRSGSLVKQRFGEAMESHWVRGANTANLEVKPQESSSACVALKKPDSDIIELSDGEDFEHASEGVTRPSWDEEIETSCSKKKLKTLILFEDVDATFCEDYGFISTIHLLSKTAKRPMILTSNSENPLLPSNLDRLHLRFTMPSMEELTGLASVVCAAEEARIKPCLVEHFAALSNRDIRKTIINLQFWCQGQDYRKGIELHRIKNQHLLDLDASHWVLPKLMPWSCPSRLSEFVDEEITKSLMLMNECNNLQQIVDGVKDNEYQLNDIPIVDGGPEHINAKKEEMLSLHWSLEDDIELVAPSDDIFDLNGFPHSPTADTQTLGRRKFNSVIFSDSEDEHLTERKPVALRRMLENSDDEALEVQDTGPSTSLLDERCQNLSIMPLNPFEGDKVEEFASQCEGMVDCPHMDGTSQPVDLSDSHIGATSLSFGVSYVPESLIVPETLFEYDNQTEFSSKTVNNDVSLCEVPITFQGKEIFDSWVSVEGKCSPVSHEYQDTCASSCHTSLRPVNTDVVGDSQFDQEEYIPRGYQIMDECSRVDFIRGCESSQRMLSTPVDQIDFVQETWRKLRNSKVDVRQHITSQEIDVVQALQITSGLSNVISDAELLLKDCQSHLHDSVDPQMTPHDGQLSNWQDDQLEIASVFAEHGICLFAKESAVLGPKMGSINCVDLAWEMLASSTNAMALGKLVSRQSTLTDDRKINLPRSCLRSKSQTKSHLSSVLQCVVPARSYLSLQGDACYEYLSLLSQISRVEANRLSEHPNNGQQRRTRVRQHYLKAGTFTLTPDDISFLGQWNNYQQLPSNCM